MSLVSHEQSFKMSIDLRQYLADRPEMTLEVGVGVTGSSHTVQWNRFNVQSHNSEAAYTALRGKPVKSINNNLHFQFETALYAV